jgi:hypothetical protein
MFVRMSNWFRGSEPEHSDQLTSSVNKSEISTLRHLLTRKANTTPPPPQGGTSPSGPRPPYFRGITITLRHTTGARTPLGD